MKKPNNYEMHSLHIREGTIFQINPEKDEIYGGQFLIATELKEWGIQGYLALTRPYEGLVRLKSTGQAFLRKKWDEIEIVGFLEWDIKSNNLIAKHGGL